MANRQRTNGLTLAVKRATALPQQTKHETRAGLCPGLLSASDSEDSSSDEESGDGSDEDVRPTVKKKKIAVKEHLTATTLPKLAPDGLVYATEESWQRVRTTVYVANPDHKETIVSSAAIHGLCDEMVKTK